MIIPTKDGFVKHFFEIILDRQKDIVLNGFEEDFTEAEFVKNFFREFLKKYLPVNL